MEPPGPPRYSEDGRFYWDGQRWVPVALPPPKQPDVWDSCANKGCIIALAIVAGIGIIIWALNFAETHCRGGMC